MKNRPVKHPRSPIRRVPTDATAIIPAMSFPASAPAPALAQPAALAAFLRGVDRRAAVLAELQTGAPTVGDAALTRAMAIFREAALESPMADWPRLFWTLLLRQPALRNARDVHIDGLPTASAAVRSALLLRLAAGLDEAAAADVLGVTVDQLRTAVIRALPTLPDGAPDASAWTQLQRNVQQRIRDLPASRALQLARMREGALAGPAERFFPQRPDRRPRWIAAVVVVALLAFFGLRWFNGARDGEVRIAALPPAGEPASRYEHDSGLIAHPDFEQLADPDGARLAQDAAFLSWMVGHVDRPTTDAPATNDAPNAADAPETSEATDAP
ncbi:hypothetical protein ACVWZN_002234 [Lysobacter sp. HA35]